MKNYTIVLLLAGSLCLSCEHTVNNQSSDHDTIATANVVVSDTAKELIKYWIFNEYNPNMNPSLEFSVKEITTDDILKKLGGQVFTVISDVPGLWSRTLFIKNRKVYDLGEHNLYGAGATENMVIADLDRNNIYELYFPLTHGSGILRTDIICHICSLDTLLRSNVSFLFPMDYTIKLSTINHKDLDIIYSRNGNEIIIGTAELTGKGTGLKLMVELNDKVPEGVKWSKRP